MRDVGKAGQQIGVRYGAGDALEALALARVIAGETPGCPFEAKLAAAHVAQRNDVWYGDAEPGSLDLAAALWWRGWPRMAMRWERPTAAWWRNTMADCTQLLAAVVLAPRLQAG